MIKDILKNHAKIIRGITFKPEDKCDLNKNNAVVCFRTKNIQDQLDESDLIAIPRSLVKNEQKIVKPKDILVSSANSWNLVGKCCQVLNPNYPATAGGFISILRSTSNQLDPNYLYRWFSSIQIQRKLRSYGNQTTNISNLDHKRTLNLKIPLPPLEEQRHIARILDTADEIRVKRRQSIEELDRLAQSVFLDMFGDPVTNPKGWEEKSITDLVSDKKHSLKRGPFGGALKKEIFVESGYKVFEQKNVIKDNFEIGTYFISDYDFKRLNAFKVVPGDILISCSGTIGKIAVIPDDAIPGVMNQALLKIRLDESIVINPFFIGLWTSPSFEQNVLGMVHGTGMKNMKSMIELKQIKFITPPLDIQLQFLSIMQSIESQKSLLHQHLTELDTLFASLQSSAFNGTL